MSPTTVVFGSSHVRRLGEFYSKEKIPPPFAFVGVGGMCTTGRKFDEALLRLKSLAPEYVIIILGGNDLCDKVPPKTIGKRLISLRKLCLAHGVQRVVIVNILPRLKPRRMTAKEFDRRREKVRRYLKCRLSRLGAFWGTGTCLDSARYFIEDGVHLSDKGHRRLARLLERCLPKLLTPS